MKQKTSGLREVFATFRRIVVLFVVLGLLSVFILWRIDSPRAERLRFAVIDAVVPRLDWIFLPARSLADMMHELEGYAALYAQNQSLRQELQQMKAWRETALQLEQQNARLLDLNGVRLDPKLSHVTAQVLADSGNRFRQSVLINVGARDGIQDGWAALDGIGLVGRIAGVGVRSSRILMLTDSTSNIPVSIQPSGQKALLSGDNSSYPLLEFIENTEQLRPGDRVVTSGDGLLLPADILVGYVQQDINGALRVALSADYARLRFLRVLRSLPPETLDFDEPLIGVPLPASEDQDG